jgi:hypothetical protein
MNDFLNNLGLGPVLFYLGMAWATLLSLLGVIWEMVKYIALTLFEELSDVALDRYQWESMSDFR